jgi:peptide/nickel transport system permease protein
VILGVNAATRGGVADRVVQVLSVLGFAIPGFLVALGLVTLFAIKTHVFKPTGYVAFSDSPTQWLSSITLPVIALSLGSIAGVAAQIRGSVMDALRQDYVRTLRSRGLSETRVVYKHVLRNAAGPALSVLAVQFVGLLGGAVIVEQIFAIPGLGQVAVGATSQGDIPLVMGLVIATAVIVVVLNLAVDLLQGWLNPKVRVGS